MTEAKRPPFFRPPPPGWKPDNSASWLWIGVVLGRFVFVDFTTVDLLKFSTAWALAVAILVFRDYLRERKEWKAKKGLGQH